MSEYRYRWMRDGTLEYGEPIGKRWEKGPDGVERLVTFPPSLTDAERVAMLGKGINGLADFLEKADQLVAAHDGLAGHIPDVAESLRRNTSAVRRAVQGNEGLRETLLAAVAAGLAYASLTNERREKDGEFRAKFRRLKAQGKTHERIAAELNMSRSNLHKLRRLHFRDGLEDKRKETYRPDLADGRKPYGTWRKLPK